MRSPAEIWRELGEWAERWNLRAPRIHVGWVDLPESYRSLARDGWVERPMLEPPAAPAHEAALLEETGLVLPDDVRALHAIHDGTFAPLLPLGMSLLPYAAMLTVWRAFAALADDFDEPEVELVDSRTHLFAVYHRRWLPVAQADVPHLVLDFAPGPAGSSGQVLMLVNECDHVVVARSLTAFLDRWLTLLADGVVRFDPEYGYACPATGEPVEQLFALS